MDFLVLGAALAGQKVKDTVAQFRSPIIPFPSTPTGDQRSSTLLTERVLFERHRVWKLRAISLWIRQTALVEAKARGFDSCWAGSVNRTTMKATKAAIIEAKWVERRLAEALEWCQSRNASRVPLRQIAVPSKHKRRSRPRPVHDTFPEVLLELPYPLPLAPSSRNLRLTVPMPPTIEWSESNPEGPPLYTPEIDEKSGELRLESARWDPMPTTISEGSPTVTVTITQVSATSS
ncbi:uncharacterized protein JCM15063_001802 [Sporobolomyces koalae]|uniref:uncharacterized protein n=1 Tax=Sporobolomyces koalae TaxID=500713 RepID=UPI0031706136